MNGQVKVSTDGHISVAQFTCTDGYYLDGNETVTCSESGIWTYEYPTCSKSILNFNIWLCIHISFSSMLKQCLRIFAESLPRLSDGIHSHEGVRRSNVHWLVLPAQWFQRGSTLCTPIGKTIHSLTWRGGFGKNVRLLITALAACLDVIVSHCALPFGLSIFVFESARDIWQCTIIWLDRKLMTYNTYYNNWIILMMKLYKAYRHHPDQLYQRQL